MLEARGINLPADMYLEGSDQHRGWFQSSLLTSMAANGQPPYRHVLTHGFVVDERGAKMSKSVGNVMFPGDVINGRKEIRFKKEKKKKKKQKRSPGKEAEQDEDDVVTATKEAAAAATATPKPQSAMPAYGADVMRLWAATQDYSKDVSVSPGIIDATFVSSKKVRNTARFLLGNLSDFDPAVDCVPMKNTSGAGRQHPPLLHSTSTHFTCCGRLPMM